MIKLFMVTHTIIVLRSGNTKYFRCVALTSSIVRIKRYEIRKFKVTCKVLIILLIN